MGSMGVSFRLMLGIFVLSIVAVGCGGGGGVGGGGNVGGGEAGQKVNLSGLEISVGSKEFTEQLILGQITLQVLENAGATVNDQIGLAGTVATGAGFAATGLGALPSGAI